jgi:hypothetical protein
LISLRFESFDRYRKREAINSHFTTQVAVHFHSRNNETTTGAIRENAHPARPPLPLPPAPKLSHASPPPLCREPLHSPHSRCAAQWASGARPSVASSSSPVHAGRPCPPTVSPGLPPSPVNLTSRGVTRAKPGAQLERFVLALWGFYFLSRRLLKCAVRDLVVGGSVGVVREDDGGIWGCSVDILVVGWGRLRFGGGCAPLCCGERSVEG